MITRLPDDTHFDAAVLAGVAGLGLTPVTAVVMRAGYDLIGGNGTVRQAVLSEDAGLKTLAASGPQDIGDPESDLVMEKERLDIIVRNYLDPATNAGLVRINGVTRRLRVDPALDEDRADDVVTDLSIHLFGLHGPGEAGRRPAIGTVTINGPTGQTAQYHPRLNNAYRRSAGFTAPALNATLPAGGLVEVFRTDTPGPGDTPYSFTLPPEAYTAQLRLATGHCPDQPRRWAIFGKIDLVPDTLVISPEVDTAVIVWRGSWAQDSFDVTRLRAVQIDRRKP